MKRFTEVRPLCGRLAKNSVLRRIPLLRTDVRAYSDRPQDTIKLLQDAFRTPGSPFYLAPGERGPAEPYNWPEHDPSATYPDPDTVNATSASDKLSECSEAGTKDGSIPASNTTANPSPSNTDSTPTPPESNRGSSKSHLGWPHNQENYEKSRIEAESHARDKGFDLESMVEWPVAWGEQDQFRHVNNVSFARYFETARVRVMQAFEPYMTPKSFRQFMDGTGMGLVVKSVSIEYKRPVTFPDSLVIMSTPVNIDERKASFGLKQEAWSLNQKTVVAKCTSVQVMYDFENLKKGIMTTEVLKALEVIASRSMNQ